MIYPLPTNPGALYGWAQMLIRLLNRDFAVRPVIKTGSVTLGTGNSTTVTETAVTADSTILLSPTSIDAYGEPWYISAQTPGTSFVVSHDVFATATRTYKYAVIG